MGFVGVFESEADGCGEALAGVDAGVTLSGRAVDGIILNTSPMQARR